MFKLKVEETGKGWDTITSKQFVTQEFMENFGNAILYHVIQEAKADLKADLKGPGRPEGIPDDPKFFESFGFDVVGASIHLYSTWPQITEIIEGRNSFPMKWLTKPFVKAIPIQNKRETIFRSAPDRHHAWIHPGFAKHSFVERGVSKALSGFDKQLANQMRRVLGKTPLV